MSFIRAKEIPPRSGNWYDYEVETKHEGKKVMQKVIRYIGKSSLRPSRSTLSGGVTGSYPVAPTTSIWRCNDCTLPVIEPIIEVKMTDILQVLLADKVKR